LASITKAPDVDPVTVDDGEGMLALYERDIDPAVAPLAKPEASWRHRKEAS
jgi:hypothetical protein